MFLFCVFSWLVEKYKSVTSMFMQFWSEFSRMFLSMFLGLIILRLKKCVFYKYIQSQINRIRNLVEDRPSQIAWKTENEVKHFESKTKSWQPQRKISQEEIIQESFWKLSAEIVPNVCIRFCETKSPNYFLNFYATACHMTCPKMPHILAPNLYSSSLLPFCSFPFLPANKAHTNRPLLRYSSLIILY